MSAKVNDTSINDKKSPAAAIIEAEKMLSAVPEDKRDLVTGILLGMDLAGQKAATA